jgi:N-acetylglucosamine kinase
MIVCFDIGGSAIKGAVAHVPDRITPLGRKATPLNDFKAFVNVLRAVLDEAGGRPDRIAPARGAVIASCWVPSSAPVLEAGWWSMAG